MLQAHEADAIMATAEPSVKGPIQDARAAGVPWASIFAILVQFAGNLPMILQKIQEVIALFSKKDTPTPPA